MRARAQLALAARTDEVRAMLAEGRRPAERTGALLFVRLADELADQLDAVESDAVESDAVESDAAEA